MNKKNQQSIYSKSSLRKSRKEEKEAAEIEKSQPKSLPNTKTSPPASIQQSISKRSAFKSVSSESTTKNITHILKNKSQSSSFKDSSLASIKDSLSSKNRSSTLPFHRSNILDQDTNSSYTSNTSIRISSCESSSSSGGSTENNSMMTTTSNSNNVPQSLLETTNTNQNLVTMPIVQQPQSVKSSTNLSVSTSSSTPFSSKTNTQNVSNQNNNNSGNSKEHSVSYLDESNLKLAIIDYSDILKLIKLQNSIEYQEWLAFNTKMYFDQINVLYGAIAEHCTLKTCPTMNAPLNNQFYWLDEKGKKFKYPASQYIDTVLTYAAKITSDETLFPTKIGLPFPPQFDSLVKKINKHLFQILAHMYHSHYTELLHLKLNTYVNSIYLHFYSFNKSFSILDEKEIEIMDALNKSMLNKHLDNTNSLQHQLIQQHPPMIHQPTSSTNSGSTGFSFFKKKLNFNLMA